MSESEMASNALSVDGRLCSTLSAVKSCVTGRPAAEVGLDRERRRMQTLSWDKATCASALVVKAVGEGGWEERGNQMSKGGEVDQFHE
jgi:hypothetical protein